MDVSILVNGRFFFTEKGEKESGRIELLASIELLKNNFTTHKNIPNFQFG